MGLLAPLYIAGVLAVGLPILFHLIRRTPHGRQAFSSLMFLSPSPPRLTRRSRLTNILLLILRALAVTLLAIAFARPFFHWGAEMDVFQSRARRIALLVDTSASMKRPDLWSQAVKQVEQVLGDVSPSDEVGLFLFDRQVRPALTFSEWNETDPSRRAAVLRGRLAAAAPTWSPTKIGDALATVADLLGEREGATPVQDKTVRQIVLISDMQQGGRVEALQGHQWPANVLLQVRPVVPKQASNASVQWVKQTAEEAETSDGRVRVRVSNQPDSTREQFSLAWANDRGPVAGIEPVKVYVAPGRSQMVRVAWPKLGMPKVDRLVLTGDDCDFDNTLYVVPPRVESLRVVYVGDDAADDVKGLRYYLQSALADTPQRKVEMISRPAGEAITDADLLGARLVVVATALADAPVVRLRKFAESGGEVFCVLKDIAAARGASQLAGVEQLEAQEASGDFALVSRVDTSHPLFAPFADARFGDFTKIHFWKHRRIKLPEQPGLRVLAWFDGGDPFLFERMIGQGTVHVATSGWQPADSQLALSTKFVPLIDGLLRRRDEAVVEAQYSVYEPIALPQAMAGQGGQAARTLVSPDGRRIELATTATTFDTAEQPGIYKLNVNGQETPLAVNLSPDESRTAPLALEELERWGARIGTKPPSEDLAMRERHLRTIELENRQKMWRWMIVGVLGLLAAETALAGRLAHRALKEQVTT
jgi:hypothetical protein